MTNTITSETPTAQLNFVAELLANSATWLSTQRNSCSICEELKDDGIAIEWHNFEQKTSGALERWQRAYRPGVLTLCLNLAGHGRLCSHNTRLNFEPLTGWVCASGQGEMRTWRKPEERHRFLIVEFSAHFLREQLAVCEDAFRPAVRTFLLSEDLAAIPEAVSCLNQDHEQLVSRLLRPQCSEGPCQLKCKGILLELMADFLVKPCCDDKSNCDRQKCLARERVRKVVALLKRDLANTPTLEQIGHEVGCSPFYLSRTFSREAGMTIPQCLRTLRMRYAAELLKRGECNVTEAAMAVGYSSLSHFSQAFCQTIGCCPTMYSSSPSHQQSAECAAHCSTAGKQTASSDQGVRNGTGVEIDVLLESVQ